MASSLLISDYDYIPEGISKEQQEVCEECRYRWFGIDLDIAKENMLYQRKANMNRTLDGYLLRPPVFSCDRENCLIDDQSLLNVNTLLSKLKRRKLI